MQFGDESETFIGNLTLAQDEFSQIAHLGERYQPCIGNVRRIRELEAL